MYLRASPNLPLVRPKLSQAITTKNHRLSLILRVAALIFSTYPKLTPKYAAVKAPKSNDYLNTLAKATLIIYRN